MADVESPPGWTESPIARVVVEAQPSPYDSAYHAHTGVLDWKTPPPAAPLKTFKEDTPCWCCCCQGPCTKEASYFMAAYICVLIAFSALAVATGAFGLVMLALAPATVVWYFAERWHWPVITRCSMFEVIGVATLILVIPLMIAISFMDHYLPYRETCSSNRSIPFWRYFFMAYIRAGVLEELLKYCAIRRLLFQSYVIDVRSLLVYGALAGCTFGVLENIAYSLMGGLGLAILRSLLTVPLHTSTGIIIACNLVEFRFGPQELRDLNCLGEAWFQIKTAVVATANPIFLHGSYNVLLFINSGECKPWMGALVAFALLGAFGFVYYVPSYRVSQVERKYPRDEKLNVHRLIAEGKVEYPCSCCCCQGPGDKGCKCLY